MPSMPKLNWELLREHLREESFESIDVYSDVSIADIGSVFPDSENETYHGLIGSSLTDHDFDEEIRIRKMDDDFKSLSETLGDAISHYKNNECEEAIFMYSEVIRSSSDYGLLQAAFINRAIAYMATGSFRQAVNDYTHALETKHYHPELYKIYNCRSTAKAALSDYQGAIEDVEEAQRLLGRSHEYYNDDF
jgi:tetratricopeptide (TPR) repeat protein